MLLLRSAQVLRCVLRETPTAPSLTSQKGLAERQTGKDGSCRETDRFCREADSQRIKNVITWNGIKWAADKHFNGLYFRFTIGLNQRETTQQTEQQTETQTDRIKEGKKTKEEEDEEEKENYRGKKDHHNSWYSYYRYCNTTDIVILKLLFSVGISELI